MTQASFSDLERAVVEMLLAGDVDALRVLREQFAASHMLKRDVTGVGFFTYFDIPAGLPRARVAGRAQIDDVVATAASLRHGAGFVLFVSDGALNMLEGSTYDDPWPRNPGVFRLRYSKLPRDLRQFGPLRDDTGPNPGGPR